MKTGALALAITALTLLSACGSSGHAARTTSVPATALTIDVRLDPSAAPQRATLHCDGAAKGTGFLAADGAAGKACTTLANQAAVDYLRNPTPPGQVCTQIFGGPETAHVSGRLVGQPVDVQLARRNGCETTGWELVRPLLQP